MPSIVINSPRSVLVDGSEFGAVADVIANNPALASAVQVALEKWAFDRDAAWAASAEAVAAAHVAEVEALKAAHAAALAGLSQVDANGGPISITQYQLRRALNQLGLRAAVEAAVAAGPQDMRDGWEYASEVRRDNPLVAALGGVLSMDPASIDNLFRLAATFD